MASTSMVEAMVERLMERLKKEHPDIDYYRKPKKEKVPRKKISRPKKLHS